MSDDQPPSSLNDELHNINIVTILFFTLQFLLQVARSIGTPRKEADNMQISENKANQSFGRNSKQLKDD